MLSTKMNEALNEQINRELFSEYLYLSMAAHFENASLDGFTNWFLVQVQEERFHAMKFYHYVNQKGGKIELKPIAGPQTKFESIKEIFAAGLKHEEFITQSINDLIDLSIKERDHATTNFLQWYVNEQVEEEANFDKLLKEITLLGDNGQGLLMLDRELATRVFTPPAPTA